MRRNRPSSTCQRCKRQCRRCSVGIPNCQNRIHSGCLHHSHSHDLRCSRCTSCHRIGQICTIQSKNQLSFFCHAHLEQHQIRADLPQSEGAGAGSCDSGTAVWAVLRKADIRTGSNCRGIVRWHQCKEICVVQQATGRTLRANRSDFPSRALRTNRSDFPRRALGAYWACFTSGTLGASRAGYTGRTLGSRSTGFTCGSLRTYRACFTRRALRADRASYTCGALGTHRTRFTGGTLRTNRTCFTSGTLRTYRARHAGRTLWANRTSWTYRALRTCRSGWAIGAAAVRFPFRASIFVRMMTLA